MGGTGDPQVRGIPGTVTKSAESLEDDEEAIAPMSVVQGARSSRSSPGNGQCEKAVSVAAYRGSLFDHYRTLQRKPADTD